MLSHPDGTPRTYKHLDPDALPPTTHPPYRGTRAECLADALLDVVQIALESSMSQEDVDEAMTIVNRTLAMQERLRFRVHAGGGRSTEAAADGVTSAP